MKQLGKVNDSSSLISVMNEQSFYEFTNQLDSQLLIIDGLGKVLFANTNCLAYLKLNTLPAALSLHSIIHEIDEKKFELAMNRAKLNGKATIENLTLTIPHSKSQNNGLYLQETSPGSNIFLCTLQTKAISTHSYIDFSQLYLNVSNNLREGIYRLSLKNGLVFINNYFLKIFEETSRKKMLDVAIADYFDDVSEMNCLFNKLIKKRFLKNEPILLCRPNGTKFWVHINCTLRYDSQVGLYVDGALNDISQQKEVGQLLKEKNYELKKINAQLDKFIYSASHDIRSPMTSIMGLVNILRMEIDQTKHIFLDKIDISLNKLDYFIKETLQFSENARKRIVSQRVNFKELIANSWDRVNGINSRVNLAVNINSNEYVFYSDYDRLGIVLKNVFRNSIQFSDYGKPSSFVNVHVQVQMNEVEVVVSDNGVGIGKPYLPYVLDMFYRAHEHLSGPGMGLYIVNETLLKLNASVRVSSDLGKGTVITISIPNDTKGVLIWKKLALSA